MTVDTEGSIMRREYIMWAIIAAAVLAAAIAGVVYMTVCVGRFGIIKSLAGEKKWLKNLISMGVIAVIFVILSFAMTAINAIIVLLNEVLFFLFFGAVMKIAGAVTGKEFTVNWQGWLAIGASVIYLGIGWWLLHNVWQKNYNLTTDKNVKLNIAMFADSHIGTTFDGEGFAEHMKTIKQQHPDILFIAGDLVDDSSNKADLQRACEALGSLNLKYGVWYVYGNHDKGYYNSRDFSAEELEDILKKNGIHVLADEYELVDDSFYVVGRKDKSDEDRKSMEELMKGLDTSKYIIVLDHQPGDYDSEAASGADLVLSGHTHGGQLFPVTYVGEWFNINDATYGYERRNDTDFIVTSGISDWELKFKTGTRSEYVMISVNNT